MVKGVRRCSAGRAGRICGFNPQRRQNMVKKTSVVLQTERNIIIHRRKYLKKYPCFFGNFKCNVNDTIIGHITLTNISICRKLTVLANYMTYKQI